MADKETFITRRIPDKAAHQPRHQRPVQRGQHCSKRNQPRAAKSGFYPARDDDKREPPQHMPGEKHRFNRGKAGDEQVQQQAEKHTQADDAAIFGSKGGVGWRCRRVARKPHAALHGGVNWRNRANQHGNALGENHHAKRRH